jgi:glycosyltransferase involved in cell wall biosynthesis
LNIGFACIWLKDRKRTRSHTAYSLFESLRELDNVNVCDLDTSLKGSALFFHKLSNMIVHKGRLKSKYNFSKRYLKSLEENLINKLQKIKNIDAIIETADIGAIKEIPFYLFQDLSIDVLIKHFQEYNHPVPGWEIFNLNDLYKRKEWQMRIYNQCAGVFAESKWLADSIVEDSGISPEKVHVIDLGINVKPELTYHSFGEKGKQEKTIFFVGRDFFRKGGHLVVEAFKLLRKNYSKNIKLIIAGPKSWPLTGGIPEGVQFIGDASRENIRKYFQISDVFCMPSYFEGGYAIVFAEALCFGIPCIGQNIQGMSEIIKPGTNGYLLNSGSIDELAELIIKVIEDKNMKSGVEKMSKSYQDYYSWDRVALDMVKIIKKDKREIS